MRMSRTEGLTCRRALGDIAEWRAARLMRLRKPQGRPVVELFGRHTSMTLAPNTTRRAAHQ
jgi:hypothetical protein